MRTITFEGGSDDLVEIGGAPGGDEFNVNPKGELGYAGTWRVEAGGDVLLVHAFYDGTWWFAAGASFDELGDGGENPGVAHRHHPVGSWLPLLGVPDDRGAGQRDGGAGDA